MADRLITLNLNHIEKGDVTGKIVNVYDSYAHALAHGATGLVTVKAVNALTGAIGSSITQTAKTAGPAVDSNGRLNIGLSDGGSSKIYFLNSTAGLFGGPLKVTVTNAQDTENSSSGSEVSSSSQN